MVDNHLTELPNTKDVLFPRLECLGSLHPQPKPPDEPEALNPSNPNPKLLCEP